MQILGLQTAFLLSMLQQDCVVRDICVQLPHDEQSQAELCLHAVAYAACLAGENSRTQVVCTYAQQKAIGTRPSHSGWQ